jgi:signal peptidase II
MKRKGQRQAKPAVCVVGLVVLDQAIKLGINARFMQANRDILAGLFAFAPIINVKQSWLGNYIAFFSRPVVAVLFNGMAIIVIGMAWAYYKTKHRQAGRVASLIFSLALAGGLCSLIDKIIWSGSLDYILLLDWFIFDLKDCYITAAEILFVVMVCRNAKEIDGRDMLRFLSGRKT